MKWGSSTARLGIMPEKKEEEYSEKFSMPDVRALNRLVGWLVTSKSARLSQVCTSSWGGAD